MLLLEGFEEMAENGELCFRVVRNVLCYFKLVSNEKQDIEYDNF